MHASLIATEASLGPNLFSPAGLTDIQQANLWNDPDFGLNNPNNFARWDALVYGRDPVGYWNLNNELKMHFGLSQEQIDSAQKNWNTYFEDSNDFITSVLPQGPAIPKN